VGVARDELAPASAYDDYISEVVYENLGRLSAETVADGRSIIVDATFRRPDDQRRFIDTYQSVSKIPLLNFALGAHDDVLRTRVRDRSDAGGSDADIAVLEEQITERDATRELEVEGQRIDTSAPVESVVAEIEAAMLEALGRFG
jgi:predicted kinase